MLETEIIGLKDQVKRLELKHECDLDCESCHQLRVENVNLRKKALRIIKFEKGTKDRDNMLENTKQSEHINIGLESDTNGA